MPSPLTLQIPFTYPSTISIEFDEIKREFGGGYDTNELVGPTDGTITVKGNFGHLPAAGSLTITETAISMSAMTYSVYLWKFYIYHKQNGEAFNITILDPATNTAATFLVKFVDSRLDYEMLTFQLYSSTLQFRQWRALS